MNNITEDFLSYKKIVHDRIKFRQAGGPHSSDFNIFDEPGAHYFKILFHFYNNPLSGIDITNHDSIPGAGAGLLHPTWNDEHFINGWDKQEDYGHRADEYVPWRYNTAYSYLLQNDELERAEYLKMFISLLSNISSQSPWYFKSIKGIEEALNRKQFTEEFVFKDQGRLVIECMPDAMDERISTLLDLYRAFAYSWVDKREILPANLRKFDMSVVVFQVPVAGAHVPKQDNWLTDTLGMIDSLSNEGNSGFATMNPTKSSHMLASYKVYEFHNCEFDYNSTVTAGDGMINEEPFNPIYNMVIMYDDMYEVRYNQFMTPPTITLTNSAYRENDEKWYAPDPEPVSKKEEKKDTRASAIHLSNDYMLKPEYINSSLTNMINQKFNKVNADREARKDQWGDTIAEEDLINPGNTISITEIGDLVLVDTMAYGNWDNWSEPSGGATPSQSNPEIKIDPSNVNLPANSQFGKLSDKALGNLFGLSVDDIGKYESVTDYNSASVLQYNYNGHGRPDDPPKNLFADDVTVNKVHAMGNLYSTRAALSNV